MGADKIMFNNTGTTVGAYTLPINPEKFNPNVGGDYAPFEVLDDGPVTQRWAFDGRLRSMSWASGIRTSFEDMILQLAELRSYIGLVKYICFGDVGSFGGFDSTTWYKHRIVDLQEEIRPGGKIKWDWIELFFQKEA